MNEATFFIKNPLNIQGVIDYALKNWKTVMKVQSPIAGRTFLCEVNLSKLICLNRESGGRLCEIPIVPLEKGIKMSYLSSFNASRITFTTAMSAVH